MKKKKYKRKKKKSIRKGIIKNINFICGLLIIGVFSVVLYSGLTISEELSNKGLRILNDYEFPSYLIEADNCMRPYDVGDGVITFGPGITYQSEELGISDINEHLNTNYNLDNNCIKVRDLKKMQRIKLAYYEQEIVDFQQVNQIVLNQYQFDGLLLLVYNSPNILNYDPFVKVILEENSNIDLYIEAADNYYRQFPSYNKMYGNGWYNRVIDSAQIYYKREYKFQN